MLRTATLVIVSFTAAGCSLVTVESTSGSKALPAELRSSSDAYLPPVGAADVPSTQPVGMVEGAGRAANDLTVGSARRVYEFATADKFREAVANLQSTDADVRRVALVRISDRSYGADSPYRDVYRTTAQVDSDGLVRAMAVRALSRVRDQNSDTVLVAALGDGHPQVRLEAAKALANLPTPAAEVPLRALAQANDQPNDVRIAAIDALRHYPNLETQRVFVGQLNSSNFALAWQSRRSLFLQTKVDHRYDEAAWLNYLASR